MLITFLMITNIILAIILIVLVLLQQGKGSDLGLNPYLVVKEQGQSI